jgi:sugar/nucleoside kinase (ribokinase family)
MPGGIHLATTGPAAYPARNLFNPTPSTAMSVLVAGTLALDSIHTSSEVHHELLGGSASYAALAAAFSGKVQLCGIVGTDFPQPHRDLFSRRSIDTANVDTVEGRTFRWTGRYHDDMNHRETLDVSIDVLEKFNPRLTIDAASASIVLLANMSPDNQLAVLDQCTASPFVIADSMDLWINIARPRLLDVMKRVDLFVINEDEAKIFTECSNLVVAGRRLLEMGPRYVVVKKGEHGAMLFGESHFFTTPAYPLTQLADPTGAGDTFAGGLAGSLAANARTPDFKDLARGIVHGSVLASFTCEAFGVRRLAELTDAEATGRTAEFRACTSWAS